ncbi:hypothetical protein [Chryseobacterium mulctrae]|uniref:hypothetical protein n=1 Tax=Chryseobacterium mulctrae TaxID=2576777 RepID=UPI001115D861|nr:hypothetical protein [Chryseobacterium mulctrae]
MKKIIYYSTFCLTSLFLMNSCKPNGSKENQKTEIVTTSVAAKKNLTNKSFLQQVEKPNSDPMLSPGFINFKSESTAHFAGYGSDIIEDCTYKVTGNSIMLVSNQLQHKYQLTIVDDKTLKDKYGYLWKLK